MSHRHYCDYSGHDWQCSENCECICGLPMQGHDHSDCPVELRACPEHAPEEQRSMAEAMTSGPDAAIVQKWREGPHRAPAAGGEHPNQAHGSWRQLQPVCPCERE